MVPSKASFEQHIKDWLQLGLGLKEIERKLADMGMEEGSIPTMMKEITKLRNARKTTKGLVFILVGAALCLVSCIITLAMPQSDTKLVLYGLTSLGIILVFIGLMHIFN